MSWKKKEVKEFEPNRKLNIFMIKKCFHEIFKSI